MNNNEKQVWIRTVVLIVALLNQVLVIVGFSPIPYGNEEIELAVATVFTVVASLITWWKNNSFTPEAKKAGEYLDELRKENKK